VAGTFAAEVILATVAVLAVVGAGPKGIAIAAKARALEAAGLDAPRVVLIDRGPVAGNWSGAQGYTSGLLPLGTPAEKDVGFPYADSWGPATPAVTAAMADYSWQRHLTGRGAYADWAYDLVVVAIGFQSRWFERLLGEQARGRLGAALAGAQLERRIDVDLSVTGLRPPLHLPVVAGLAQGPGFPNLSCLGLLSDRILRRYVAPGEPALLDLKESDHV
jgi:hypothetical protein